MKRKPSQLIGIPEPCAVPWERMKNVGGGQRYCEQCKKNVHDFAGKTEKEVAAILRDSKGDVCGSFLVDDRGEFIYALPRPVKPIFLRHLAATASLLLLQQSAMTAPAMPKTEWCAKSTDGAPWDEKPKEKAKTNTLVTGVIINLQDDNLIPRDVEVRIYHEKELITKVKSRKGLFVVDLGDKLRPEDQIQVVIWKDNHDSKDYHDGKSMRVTLAEAQNLRMKISYTLILPPRVGGRTLYINNI